MNPDPALPGSEARLPVLDPAIMDQLLSLDDGATGLIQEMFGLFVEDTPPRMEALRTALAEGRLEALADTAHAVKGAASTMGAPRVRQVAQALETGGRTQAWAHPPEALLDQLQQAYSEAVAGLEAFLAERNAVR